MTRFVYTDAGRAAVRHWDLSRIEVYSLPETGAGCMVGVVCPDGDRYVAYGTDEETIIAYTATREVAVETLLRVSALRERREARGMDDPFNRLCAHVQAGVARGEGIETVEE